MSLSSYISSSLSGSSTLTSRVLGVLGVMGKYSVMSPSRFLFRGVIFSITSCGAWWYFRASSTWSCHRKKRQLGRLTHVQTGQCQQSLCKSEILALGTDTSFQHILGSASSWPRAQQPCCRACNTMLHPLAFRADSLTRDIPGFGTTWPRLGTKWRLAMVFGE